MADRTEGHDRVVAVIEEHAPSLLRLARRHSLCLDDAHDAYQRALEIYLRKVDDVDASTAASWLRTVVKHEAMAVREQRRRLVGPEEVDLDQWVSPAGDGEERAVEVERLTRAAEALRGCKPDELSAMVLKAEGHSYKEICSITGWSYTKVNRCLAEGRARFVERYAAIESGAECRRVAPLLSALLDAEATHDQIGSARRHLRNCSACRATLRELQDSGTALHSVLPVGTLAGAGPAGLPGAIGRLWEAMTAGAHDASLRLQAVLEAGTASKAAAAAATVAAMAGGGAAVHGAEDPAGQPTTVAARTRPAVAVTAVSTAAPTGHAPAGSSRPKALADPEPRRSPREFGFEAEAAAATPSPTPEGAESPARPPRSESFGFER